MEGKAKECFILQSQEAALLQMPDADQKPT
jgi:hypothetical protein